MMIKAQFKIAIGNFDGPGFFVDPSFIKTSSLKKKPLKSCFVEIEP
jgi:hypothetical protein